MRGSMIVTASLACAIGGGRVAQAAPATLAAVAPSPGDVRKAVLVGPAGEVYEPDGKGAWVRKRAGGTALELVGAATIGGAGGAGGTGGTVIAAARNGPPFKLNAGAWTAVFLAPKARAIVGTGTRVLAAVGTQVFALDTSHGEPTKLADAPARVIALAASKAHAVIVTDGKGLLELKGPGSWKAIAKAPKVVRALVSDRWALVDKGALDLVTMRTVAWPAGVRVDEATALGTTLYVIATRGKTRELLTVTPGAVTAAKAKPRAAPKAGAKCPKGAKGAKGAKSAKGTKGPKGAAGNCDAAPDEAAAPPAPPADVDRDAIPLDASAVIVGVVVDDDKRVVIAARDGKIAMRAAGATGAWSMTEVRDEVPANKPPGPGPALGPAAAAEH